MKQSKERLLRHELKYLIREEDVPMIRNRINHMLSLDTHVGSAGFYTISSLYFDDSQNSCFYEKENGVEPREKFRIRIYNHRTDRIVLECKRKERGKTLKTTCPLEKEQVVQLMRGIPLGNIGTQPPLLQKLTVQMQTRRLHPVVIVEYDRIPYIYPTGNVRVTLDVNISSSQSVMSFLDETIPKRPVLPIGQQLLEVKYDEFLPDYIYRNLQLENLRQTAFSKYYICRKYTR